jgi:hypothetical protein
VGFDPGFGADEIKTRLSAEGYELVWEIGPTSDPTCIAAVRNPDTGREYRGSGPSRDDAWWQVWVAIHPEDAGS